jgi:hypothetical protein
MRPRRGWVFVDVLMATILVALIAAMLGAAAGWQQRAMIHLANARAASRTAESALLTLQSGHALAPDSPVHIRRLAEESNIPGQVWVQVDAAEGGRAATLVGLVPQNTLPAGGS